MSKNITIFSIESKIVSSHIKSSDRLILSEDRWFLIYLAWAPHTKLLQLQ